MENIIYLTLLLSKRPTTPSVFSQERMINTAPGAPTEEEDEEQADEAGDRYTDRGGTTLVYGPQPAAHALEPGTLSALMAAYSDSDDNDGEREEMGTAETQDGVAGGKEGTAERQDGVAAAEKSVSGGHYVEQNNGADDTPRVLGNHEKHQDMTLLEHLSDHIAGESKTAQAIETANHGALAGTTQTTQATQASAQTEKTQAPPRAASSRFDRPPAPPPEVLTVIAKMLPFLKVRLFTGVVWWDRCDWVCVAAVMRILHST